MKAKTFDQLNVERILEHNRTYRTLIIDEANTLPVKKKYVDLDDVLKSWDNILDEIANANTDPELYVNVLNRVKIWRKNLKMTKTTPEVPQR